MTDDRADLPLATPDWEALARYSSGESAPDEAKAIARWLAAHPDEAARMQALDGAVGGWKRAAESTAAIDTEAALKRVKARLQEPFVVSLANHRRGRTLAHVRWSSSRFAAAAGVVLVIGAGAWLLSRTSPATDSAVPRSYATGVGQRDSVRLDDGSLVILGPKAELRVTSDFGKGSRSVALTGQAYFDVVHDAARPFTVESGSARIADVGTSFAVDQDANGATVVVVASGVVALSDAAQPSAASKRLVAGDVGVAGKGGISVTHTADSTSNELQWMKGRLVFRDATMRDVALDLGRWYGVELRFADSTMQDRHLTASFESEALPRVLNVIGLALNADLSHEGSVVTVRARK